MTDTIVQPHLRFGSEMKADCAILPGDPKRVDHLKQYLDNAKDVAYNREFKSVYGHYKGCRILAVSTGIGGASMGIAVEELNNIGVQTMIRIGSCGALQPELKLGSLVIAAGAVRADGASKAYIDPSYPAVPDSNLLFQSIQAAKRLHIRYQTGIIRSHDSFYTDEERAIDEYWSSKGVLASDMETAALYTIGRLRKIKTLSILNVVVEYSGSLDTSINSYVNGEKLSALGEENEILTALETVYELKKRGI